MGSSCLGEKKQSTKPNKMSLEKKKKKNLINYVYSWHIILDFLSYKELQEVSKVCRKLHYTSKNSKILIKFFKNKDFIINTKNKDLSNNVDLEHENYYRNYSLNFKLLPKRDLESLHSTSKITANFRLSNINNIQLLPLTNECPNFEKLDSSKNKFDFDSIKEMVFKHKSLPKNDSNKVLSNKHLNKKC